MRLGVTLDIDEIDKIQNALTERARSFRENPGVMPETSAQLADEYQALANKVGRLRRIATVRVGAS